MKKQEKSKEFLDEPTNICSVCGELYSYALSSGINPDGTRWCQHDDDVATSSLDEYDKFRKQLEIREKIVDAHKKGKLSKSHYSLRKSKITGKMEPYLSPKRMAIDSSLGGKRYF